MGVIKLKNLLKEDPDVFRGNIDYMKASYTFLIYKDNVDKKLNWLAYDYNNSKVLCQNPEVEREIYNINNYTKTIENRPMSPHISSFKYTQTMSDLLDEIDGFPAHRNLLDIVIRLRRTDNVRTRGDDLGHNVAQEIQCDARIFDVYDVDWQETNYYFIYWKSTSNTKKYKSYIDDFFNRVGVSKNNIFFDDEEIPYHDFFGTDVDTPESEVQIAKKKLAQQLHMQKALLDKKLLQVLQSNPKDLETLYARMEKQFNLPIAKIRSLFRGIPLDKLVAKQLRELFKRS